MKTIGIFIHMFSPLKFDFMHYIKANLIINKSK